MGWTPAEVRRESMSDFLAAFEGWCVARGDDPPLKDDDVQFLDDLMARYPDEPPEITD